MSDEVRRLTEMKCACGERLIVNERKEVYGGNTLFTTYMIQPHSCTHAACITIRCACGEELQVDETMQDEDGGLTIKVRPHDCREYNHAAVRRVCDRLAVLLTGD